LYSAEVSVDHKLSVGEKIGNLSAEIDANSSEINKLFCDLDILSNLIVMAKSRSYAELSDVSSKLSEVEDYTNILQKIKDHLSQVGSEEKYLREDIEGALRDKDVQRAEEGNNRRKALKRNADAVFRLLDRLKADRKNSSLHQQLREKFCEGKKLLDLD